MKNLIVATAFLAGLPAIATAQSDLRKIGQFLQGLQQIQQNQQNQNQNGQQPPNGTYQAPYRVDPNSSGNTNQGNFRDPNSFFGPSGGTQQGGIIYRNNQPFNGNTQMRYPQNTYPNGTYNGNQIIYPNSNTVRSSGTSYSDPPTAPPRSYSRQPIVLRCSPDAVGICNYELLTGSGKAFPYTIRAGQTQNLVETTDWSIRYRVTPTGAYQTYRLRGGKTYEMRNDGGQWQFYMAP